MSFWQSHHRRGMTVGAHLVLWAVALFGALALRFEGAIPNEYLRAGLRALPLLLLVRASSFWLAGLFHGILRYAGLLDLRSIIRVTTLGTLVFALSGLLLRPLALPRSIYVLEWLIAIAFAGGLRFAVRLLADSARTPANLPSVLLVGAGNAGELFIRDLQRTPHPTMRVAAVLDDDRHKIGSLIHGISVEGPVSLDVLRSVSARLETQRVILAIPTAPGTRTREIFTMCRELGLSVKTVPSLQQLADGAVSVSKLRDVAIEDLLRRDPVDLDTTGLSRLLRGRRVLVTGAAGSIGSELVRQIAPFEPEIVCLFDHNENGLFFLERELRASFPELKVAVLLGDVRDANRLEQVFAQQRPALVYHAAAHKHVPLMEANPGEAVRNNVLGTRLVADAAAAANCDAFVLISTDKAVNPTSVMGTTKRIAEMYVQALSANSKTRFVAVRFGNVLGSAGSVVPIFRQQIADGGPVKVTHSEMRRYFMTIPEASQLVLQASGLGKGGEIFILDMGEPVRILDLARDMIVLSGFTPDVDIPIQITGMRPGEKLYEELMLAGEQPQQTTHAKINVASVEPRNHREVAEAIDRLVRLTQRVDSAQTLRAELASMVPEATLESLPSTSPQPEALGVNHPKPVVA